MCIFCKIVNKEIPSHVLYEDEKVIAFLDITQVTKGHTLVIPKKHCETLFDCDDETFVHVMKIAKQMGYHLLTKLEAKGMNMLSNAYEIAGQSVPHFHVHLIPRYDEHDSCSIQFKESQPQDLENLTEKLKLIK